MNGTVISWIITIAVAVVVGSVIGIVLAKKKSGKLSSARLKPWESLMQSQISLDELTLSDIVKWCNICKKDVQDGDTLFLFKATPKNVRKLSYQYPEQVDENNNVIACKINTNTGDISNIQLFTFGEMSEQVNELFGGEDYTVINF